MPNTPRAPKSPRVARIGTPRPDAPHERDPRWDAWDQAKALVDKVSEVIDGDGGRQLAIKLVAESIAAAAARPATSELARHAELLKTMEHSFGRVLAGLNDTTSRLGMLETLWRDRFGSLPEATALEEVAAPEIVAPEVGDTIQIPLGLFDIPDVRAIQSHGEMPDITDAAAKIELESDLTKNQLTPRKSITHPKVYYGNPHPEKRGKRRDDMVQSQFRDILYDLCEQRGWPVHKKDVAEEAERRGINWRLQFSSTYLKNSMENIAIRFGDAGYWCWALPIPEKLDRYWAYLPRQKSDYVPARQQVEAHNEWLASLGIEPMNIDQRSPGKSHKDGYQLKRGQKRNATLELDVTPKAPETPRDLQLPPPSTFTGPSLRRPSRGVGDLGA